MMQSQRSGLKDALSYNAELTEPIELASAYQLPPSSASWSSLPIVLPQTSRSLRGKNFSPFVRAYVPKLADVGIDVDTFVAFIDGLNEAFIAHPVFEAVNIVGATIGTFGYLMSLQLAGGGISLAAVGASKATSHARTKAYLKAINQDLFHPVGLHATIATTKDMMSEIGCESMRLTLPPLDTAAFLDEDVLAEPVDEEKPDPTPNLDDPRMRRVKALEGHVMQLDFGVPPAVSPNTLLQRMSDAQAKRLSRKQQKKMAKSREKGSEKYHQKLEEAKEKNLEGEIKIAELETKQEREKAKLQSLKTQASSEHLLSKSIQRFRLQKLERDLVAQEKQISTEQHKLEAQKLKYQEDAEKARDKPDQKEEKTAQKIRWVVISNWQGAEYFDDDQSDLTSTASNQ